MESYLDGVFFESELKSLHPLFDAKSLNLCYKIEFLKSHFNGILFSNLHKTSPKVFPNFGTIKEKLFSLKSLKVAKITFI